VSGLPCSTCADARRPDIDALLVSGSSLRDIAGRFGTSKSALSRHRPHVGQAIVRASERKGERLDETILRKVERLEADARRLGEKAEAEGDLRCALASVRELLDVVKLLREMTPKLEPSPADAERALAWFAEDIGVSVDELRASCEEHARIADELRAGRTPPHTAKPAPFALPLPAPAQAAVPEPAKADSPMNQPPPAPPRQPFRMSV
jgi:hypothetical protein